MATEAHRPRLRAGLAGGGAGPGSRLITLDAAEMLDDFMTGDRFDYSRFQAAAEDLVNLAADAGQPVRIYGELVALLWDAGQVTLALELETMWNDLASRLPFSLFCAYPARVAAPDGDMGAVAQVCRLHTGVIAPSLELHGLPEASSGGNEAVRSFPGTMESVRAARVFTVGRLDPWAANAVAADAAIVIAELASNAVLHARTPFTVAVSWWPDRVRIAVRDAAPLPDGGDSRLVRKPGHGLDLVARIARSWAVEPLADGKVVWAELSRPNVHLVV